MLSHYQKYGRKWYLKNRNKELERNKKYYKRRGYILKKEKYKDMRDRILKNRYGISEKEYLELLKKQNNKCAICGEVAKKTLDIDHCHTTDKVRGLLCNNCNRGIGHLKENINILKKAIEYLT